MPWFRLIRRPVAALLLVWLLPACMTWKTTALAPGQTLSEVRLTVGPHMQPRTVKQAVVFEDSVSGVWRGQPFGVARDDVHRAEVKKFSVGMTALAVLVPVGLVFLAGSAVAMYELGQGWEE